MSIISLLNVEVLNNPAKFTDPYELEITFECLESPKEDIEWKLVYVGSSTSDEHDQELDSLLVGPVPIGVNRFTFSADPPAPELIPQDELVSITVILLTGSYKDKPFVQVGYYVNNEYDTEELQENPPAKVAIDHVVRNILAKKPRVTRHNIEWDQSGPADEYIPQADVDLEEDEPYGNSEEDANDELVDRDEADEVEVEGEDDAEDEEEDEDLDQEDDQEDDLDLPEEEDLDQPEEKENAN